MKIYRNFFKRIIDFIGALFLIILLSPAYIVCCILIKINMGSPILFAQDRPGKNEKIFKIYKFRTMNSAKDEDGNLLPDKDRITKLGIFLRKTSLDEIPQFFNVLKGDMSFIGPRPLLPRYLPYYTEREKIRHAVRPGITGLAQINGRNCIKWSNKLEFDVKYVEKLSLLVDISIVLQTIKKVLKHSGVEVVSSEQFLDVERQIKEKE